MRNPLLLLLASVPLLSCYGAAGPQGTTTTVTVEIDPENAIDTISASDLRAHVEVLASDEYEGRGTLEPGYEKAAKYLAAQMLSFGLAALPGQDSLLVSYELDRRGFDPEHTSLSIAAGGDTQVIALGDTGIPFDFSDDESLDADIVFAGYGISAPEMGYDDYEGLDVKGKWVLVLRHAPGYKDPKSPFYQCDTREQCDARESRPRNFARSSRRSSSRCCPMTSARRPAPLPSTM